MSTTPSSTTPTDRAPSAQAGAELVPFDLAISGMTCASCAARIEKRLNRLDGVTATVNYATEHATVYIPENLAPADVIAAVEAAGYTAAVPKTATSELVEGAEPIDETAPLRQRLLISLALSVPVIA